MSVKVFLSGDVMTGRGIDQILRHPGDPTLYETWAKSAERYVELAERRNGALPRNADPSYVWGEARGILEDLDVDFRVINLETAVTDSADPWPGKGIHYRMHPGNIETITAAQIDVCVLANNHVLDWSYRGLAETLETLHGTGVATPGAGVDANESTSPVTVDRKSNRVVVLAAGTTSSGILDAWAAGPDRPGVNLLTLSAAAADAIIGALDAVCHRDDIRIVSLHWGGNWGYAIPPAHRRFARRLIDGGVHIVHGHSSHHPMGIEIRDGGLILYGCGDLINDYEGIGGHEAYHPGLGLLYVATIDDRDGEVTRLDMIPMRMRRFRLERAPSVETEWMRDTLTRESRDLGTTLEHDGDGHLSLRW